MRMLIRKSVFFVFAAIFPGNLALIYASSSPLGWQSVTHQVSYCAAPTCPAAGGFTVFSDGRYALAPEAPPMGNLATDEFETLTVSANAVAAEDLTSEICVSFVPTPKLNEYALSIQRPGQSALVIDSLRMSAQQGLSCYRGEEKTVDRLRLEIIQLSKKYDPGSRPSAQPPFDIPAS